MMRRADAERLTGYHVGGISPFGQKRRVPVALDAAVLSERTVFENRDNVVSRSNSTQMI